MTGYVVGGQIFYFIFLRIEPEVLGWYRTHYTHYQTQINAVLKAFKEASESR